MPYTLTNTQNIETVLDVSFFFVHSVGRSVVCLLLFLRFLFAKHLSLYFCARISTIILSASFHQSSKQLAVSIAFLQNLQNEWKREKFEEIIHNSFIFNYYFCYFFFRRKKCETFGDRGRVV